MKVMLVCTSGGHFATLKGLKSFWSSHSDRVWVTHLDSSTLILQDWGEKVYFLPYQAPKDCMALLRNMWPTYKIMGQEKPDLVISTGASIAINCAYMAKLVGARFVFIESVSRYRDLSLSGKAVYPITDEFLVERRELCSRYPRAKFRGYTQAV